MGTTLSSGLVTWQDWPSTGISDKFIQRKSPSEGSDQVAGAIARASFYAGEPIVDAKLIRSDRGFMSAILPEGKRAVATKISADTSAGGFILPNDRVDVIMTRHATDTDVTSQRRTSPKPFSTTFAFSPSIRRSRTRTAKRSSSARPRPSS